ncbi:MAG: type II toxin-antitoxin system RelE/ParE family toxin [Planctomycetes bacterium]|nr:type II toxin-antitoxin system RelE/ParE family toxin [Planctomycetota bacterium]
MFSIVYVESVEKDFRDVNANDRTRILDKIEEQLSHEPGLSTRNKKEIIGLEFPWKFEKPAWELRIGEHRVFYDFDEKRKKVTVRAIRHKPPHKTTEEIL